MVRAPIKMCATSEEDVGMINQQKRGEQERVYRVICNPVPTSFQAHGVTIDRPFLVHLVFADLSSLHPSSFHEMIFTLVNL